MNRDFSDMFRQAALVVAHPDDEALWFSSILERMEEIVICFMDVVSHPDWSEGRRRCSAFYPLPNATFLGLHESEVFNGADWPAPVPTHYGLEMSKKSNVFPGRTATPMQEAIHRSEGKPYFPERLLQPEDVAAMVLAALALPKGYLC